MKKFFVFVLLVTAVGTQAQDPQAVSASQAAAIREYPTLGERDSEFNRQFIQKYNSLKAAGDGLLATDNWPEVLAKQVGDALGISPVSQRDASIPSSAVQVAQPATGETASGKDSGISQLGGFLGLDWGSPPDKAKTAMLARDGVSYDAKESTDTNLMFTGGTFSGYPVKYLSLVFYNGGLCEGTVMFSSDAYSEAAYSDLETALAKKYSNPDESSSEDHLAEWYWPKPKEDDYSHSDANEELSLFMGDSFIITYKNVPLANKAEELRKQKLSTKDL
jgi:hypothetical protein